MARGCRRAASCQRNAGASVASPNGARRRRRRRAKRKSRNGHIAESDWSAEAPIVQPSTLGGGGDPAVAAPEQTPADVAPVVSSTPAPSALSWTHVRHAPHAALWFFCGESPSGFATRATLRASGYRDPSRIEWSVKQGADKVFAPGGFRGPEITLRSSAGSRRRGDVIIEVREGTGAGAPSYQGQLTVRKPHRLILESTSDTPNCPAWAGCATGCPAYWTGLDYRIKDNLGGTMIGASVNETFPGTRTSDQPNNWGAGTVVTPPFWANTNGTFTDNVIVSCVTPPAVAPASSNWGNSVDHMPQEFYVGSIAPGRGCRVQTHTLHRYRGFADHEGITTPAP